MSYKCQCTTHNLTMCIVLDQPIVRLFLCKLFTYATKAGVQSKIMPLS